MAITTVSLDKNSTMLIIGRAATSYKYLSISYEDDPDFVRDSYGDCELTDAFCEAYKDGCPGIFLLSIHDSRDLLKVLEPIAQNDFAYIVPICTNLSDTYYDAYNHNKQTYYMSYVLKYLGEYSESTLVVTDKHASLFEDQDAYLSYMNAVTHNFEYACTLDLRMDNILCVANNLKDTQHANLRLAIALCTTDVSEYPQMNFGEALFLLDERERAYDFSYFQTHQNGITTLENFVNFLPAGVTKIATVNRIVKVIKRELSLSEFEGVLYSEYQRVRIHERIVSYLGRQMHYIINKYDVISIEPYQTQDGTVSVLVRFVVCPINSTERITIDREVTV